ncbi:MAG: Ig-like domain-containing protein [Myxococcales bacterium]|nr:Ig-like domain-containing protein [Myxococcales bacterium]
MGHRVVRAWGLLPIATMAIACGASSRPPDAGVSDAAIDAGGVVRDAAADVDADAGMTVAPAMDAAVADDQPPEIVARTPEPDADNVWVRAPIVVRFSEAIEAEGLSDAVTLSAAEATVETELELSDDGTELVLRITTPPASPALLTLELGDGVRDLAGNSLSPASWSWTLPAWHTVSLAQEGMEAEPWDVALALDRDGNPMAAWHGADGLTVARHDAVDARWEATGEGATVETADAAIAPRLAIDDGNAAVIAFRTAAGGIAVERFADGAWGAVAATVTVGAGEEVLDFDLALAAGAPVLVLTVGDSDGSRLRVLREDDGWQAVATPPDHGDAASSAWVALAADDDGALALAWEQDDGWSDSVYAARLAPGADAWEALGGAVDLSFDAHGRFAKLAIAPGRQVLLSWTERGDGVEPGTVGLARYVVRWLEGRWEAVGGGLVSTPSGRALAVGAHGEAVVFGLDADGAQLILQRHNESPTATPGLSALEPAPCAFPPANDPTFPQTLEETGCFDDVPGREVKAGLIPYDLNTPLWSDGALKRRFLALPEGETIGYTESDSWQMPVGTVLVKEFLLERVREDPLSVIPVETRFLIKRCEPGSCRAAWEGYSYQWSEDGSGAQLLDNDLETFYADWAVDGGSHSHGYPGRSECTRCHALAAGGSLGLTTAQLNRNQRYGEVIDHQLLALARAGVFGDSFGDAELSERARLPRSADPAFSDEARTRAYVDANCASCHRPGGRWPVIDYRYDAPLLDASAGVENICDLLVPGDSVASLMYIKDAVRFPDLPPGFSGDPMPPLGTLLPDTRQLEVTARWIDNMSSCP